MARKKVVSGIRPWRCLICDYAGLSGKKNFPTDRALAQHIAMMGGVLGIKQEEPHKNWRRKQGIAPVEYQTMEEVQKMMEQILQIISANPNLFRMSDEVR